MGFSQMQQLECGVGLQRLLVVCLALAANFCSQCQQGMVLHAYWKDIGLSCLSTSLYVWDSSKALVMMIGTILWQNWLRRRVSCVCTVCTVMDGAVCVDLSVCTCANTALCDVLTSVSTRERPATAHCVPSEREVPPQEKTTLGSYYRSKRKLPDTVVTTVVLRVVFLLCTTSSALCATCMRRPTWHIGICAWRTAPIKGGRSDAHARRPR